MVSDALLGATCYRVSLTVPLQNGLLSAVSKSNSYMYKENFTVDMDHNKKSKETRVVTYTCRYSSGH